MPSSSRMRELQPSTRAAFEQSAVMWRTSPSRYWPVMTGGGPPIALDELVRLEIPEPEVDGAEIHATVLAVDRFGNVSLNLTREQLEEAEVVPGTRVELARGTDRWFAIAARTFGDAPTGELILYEDSYRSVAVAVSRGSAAELLGVDEGSRLTLMPQ